MTVVFELFGLPGAGKTTLVNAIERGAQTRTRHELAAVWDRQPPLLRALVALRTLVDLRLLAAALRFAVDCRLRAAESWSRLGKLLLVRHWWLRQPGVLLFDQAALQTVWSILYASGRVHPDANVIAPLLRAVFAGMDASVVVIAIDPETSARRVTTREKGNSRFERMAEAEVVAHATRSAGLVDAIVAAASLAGLAVHRLDGTELVEALAGQLATIVAGKEALRVPAA